MFSNVRRIGGVDQPDTSARSNRYELEELMLVAASAQPGLNSRPPTMIAAKNSAAVPVELTGPTTGNSLRPLVSFAAISALYRSTCANASRIRNPPRTNCSGANCEVSDASNAASAAAVVMVSVVGADASNRVTTAASSPSNQARSIWVQISPDS